MEKHLVFYDGECGLCDHVVQFLLKRDSAGVFVFAPLQGVTAHILPPYLQKIDTLVLVENIDLSAVVRDDLTQNTRTPFPLSQNQLFIQGKAVWRICWLLGGKWTLMGWLNFLPAWVYDWGYRWVAQNRHRFFSQSCQLPDEKLRDRFLP